MAYGRVELTPTATLVVDRGGHQEITDKDIKKLAEFASLLFELEKESTEN